MNAVGSVAALAGRSTGYAVKFLRLFGFGRKEEKAPAVFRDILANAIQAEVKRAGVQLTDGEIEELVRKIIELLEKLFRGEISIDAIFSAPDLLGTGEFLRDFLAPLVNNGASLSEKKRGLLMEILEENILLQQAK